MGNNSNVNSGNEGPSKRPVAMIVVIVVLSLATWYFFHLESMPLTPAETTFVVFIWVVVVLAGKWLWRRLHDKGKPGVSP
jgi:Na+/proline symporter